MFKSIFGKSFATTSFACAAAVLLFAGVFAPATFAADFVKQNLNYTDSLDSLANPECGFYDAKVLRLMPDGKPCSACPAERWSTWGKIFQMRIDISRFSENGCFGVGDRCETQRFNNAAVADSCHKAIVNNPNKECRSIPFTKEALGVLREYFEEARAANRTLIVRLAYDGWYDGHQNGEPDQELIRTHLHQIGPLYSEFSDVIVFVEVGLYGRWGEQNGSIQGTNEVIADAMQTILESTNSEIKTGPRRPDIIAAWAGLQTRNEKNWTGFEGFVVGSDAANAAAAAKGDTIYRVGMYNDGYLGNSGDMGSAGMGNPGPITREKMVRWLEYYGAHVPYGGELVYNSNESRGPINTVEYMSYEGFRTHTSYLNRYHDINVITGLPNQIFRGEHDPEYVGHDGFTYVRNHLGYRYILRESNVMDSVGIGGKFKANLKIENVGFGNMTQRRKVTLVFKQGSMVREIVPSKAFDPWDLLSRPVTLDATAAEINSVNGSVAVMQYAKYGSGLHEVSIEAKLPENLPQGEWNVYVRISKNANYPADSNYQTVRFGNPVSQFDSTTGSNYIGKFVLSEKVEVEEESSSSIAQSSSSGSVPKKREITTNCIAFKNGVGHYGENCYKSGLDSMKKGVCYTMNVEREDGMLWVGSDATNDFWWMETPCIDKPESVPGKGIVPQKLANISIRLDGSALYVRGARDVNVFDLNGNLILSRNGLDEMGSIRIEDSALQQNHGVLIVRGKNALGQTAIQKVRLAR